MATPEGRAEFKKVFESLDGDGALSSKEWGQGIGKKWHEDDAFKELMKKYFGAATIGEVGRMFSKINADGDAKLTWEEWCTAVGKDAELDAAAALIQQAAGGGGGNADLDAAAALIQQAAGGGGGNADLDAAAALIQRAAGGGGNADLDAAAALIQAAAGGGGGLTGGQADAALKIQNIKRGNDGRKAAAAKKDPLWRALLSDEPEALAAAVAGATAEKLSAADGMGGGKAPLRYAIEAGLDGARRCW